MTFNITGSSPSFTSPGDVGVEESKAPTWAAMAARCCPSGGGRDKPSAAVRPGFGSPMASKAAAAVSRPKEATPPPVPFSAAAGAGRGVSVSGAGFGSPGAVPTTPKARPPEAPPATFLEIAKRVPGYGRPSTAGTLYTPETQRRANALAGTPDIPSFSVRGDLSDAVALAFAEAVHLKPDFRLYFSERCFTVGLRTDVEEKDTSSGKRVVYVSVSGMAHRRELKAILRAVSLVGDYHYQLVKPLSHATVGALHTTTEGFYQAGHRQVFSAVEALAHVPFKVEDRARSMLVSGDADPKTPPKRFTAHHKTCAESSFDECVGKIRTKNPEALFEATVFHGSFTTPRSSRGEIRFAKSKRHFIGNRSMTSPRGVTVYPWNRCKICEVSEIPFRAMQHAVTGTGKAHSPYTTPVKPLRPATASSHK
jgi:hypothetical protein